MKKSDNCNHYANAISVVAEVSAKGVSDARCSVDPIGIFSCQTTDTSTPDAVTRKQLQELLDKELRAKSCSPTDVTTEFHTFQVGTLVPNSSDQELAEDRLASNCLRVGNDPNLATHTVTAVCHHPYDFKDAKTGETWRDYSKKFVASMGTCDVSDRAIPKVHEEVMRIAAYNANDAGWPIESFKNLTCNIDILPR